MTARALVPALALLVAVAGCGNSSGLHPVRGKVLYKGDPATGATVTFVRKSAAIDDQTAQAVVGDDGSFSLACAAGAGARPGDYVVLVEWKVGAGKARGRAPALNAPDRLKGRYLDPVKPRLAATVEAKANSLPAFELE